MNKYALLKNGAHQKVLINGVLEDFQFFREQPENIPHKGVTWLPVVYQNANFDPRNQDLGEEEFIIEPTRFLVYRAAVNKSREQMIEQVVTERERRLALGFDYNFGDARGVHRIGTTTQDMKGWDEVTKAATCLTTLGLGTTPINVVTDTGAVTVTSIEWLQIIVAATVARQPIWAASFTLQSMLSIPADYTDDSWWT